LASKDKENLYVGAACLKKQERQMRSLWGLLQAAKRLPLSQIRHAWKILLCRLSTSPAELQKIPKDRI